MDMLTDLQILQDLLDALSKRSVAVYAVLEARGVPHFLDMCSRLQINAMQLRVRGHAQWSAPRAEHTYMRLFAVVILYVTRLCVWCELGLDNIAILYRYCDMRLNIVLDFYYYYYFFFNLYLFRVGSLRARLSFAGTP